MRPGLGALREARVEARGSSHPPGMSWPGFSSGPAPGAAAPPLPGRRGVPGGTGAAIAPSPSRWSQSCPFRIDYPGRPFNDRFPGLIKLFSPRAAVPACSPAAPPKTGRGGTSLWLELGFASKPNLRIHPGARRGCFSPGQPEQGQLPRLVTSRFAGSAGCQSRGCRCFSLAAAFLGANPTTSLGGVGSAPTRVSIHNDFGGKRRELGGRRRLRSRAGSQPWDCQELLLFAYLNVPFQPALSVETAIFCLIVSLAEVTHRLLTHSLLL